MNKFSVREQERRHATGYLVQLRRSVVNFDIFLTWNVLASFAGAVAVTGLFTQMLKKVRGLVKLPTQWLSYFIAVFVLGLTTAATGGFEQSWSIWALIPFNAALVSTASNGAYQMFLRMRNGKPSQ